MCIVQETNLGTNFGKKILFKDFFSTFKKDEKSVSYNTNFEKGEKRINNLNKYEKSAGDNSNIRNTIGINNNFNSEQFHYYDSLTSDIIFIIIKNIIEYNENKQLISQLIRTCTGSWGASNCG